MHFIFESDKNMWALKVKGNNTIRFCENMLKTFVSLNNSSSHSAPFNRGIVSFSKYAEIFPLNELG